MLKWNRGLRVLGAAAVGVLAAAGIASASASVTTEQSGSILVWPKVVWDGTRDTIIQLANTGNPTAQAHCFYVNAAPSVNPCAPASAQNPAQWLETDFDVFLTKQQPTHWVVSSGRQTDGAEGGFDPGLIPPVPMCFKGELKCIQTLAEAPYPGNALKGEATLRDIDGDVSSYNAIAFLGNTSLQNGTASDTDLQLTLTDKNTTGEYSACPDRLLVNHFAYGAPDLAFTSPDALGPCSNCGINTSVTLVPCQENFETQIAGKVTVQFQIFNEFEQAFSASTTVNCWLDGTIDSLTQNQTTFNVLGTIGAFTRIHPNPGTGGVIGIAEELHWNNSSDSLLTPGVFAHSAHAAYNLNIEGNQFDSATDDNGKPLTGGVIDHIIIPGNAQ